MSRQPRTSELGFTLMEVMVALLIFSVSALAIAKVFSSNIAFNTQNEQLTGAILAANQVLDLLRVGDVTNLPATGTDAVRNITIGTRSYQVTVSYCNPNTYCTSNNIRFIHVVTQLHVTTRYAVDTIFAQLR